MNEPLAQTVKTKEFQAANERTWNERANELLKERTSRPAEPEKATSLSAARTTTRMQTHSHIAAN
jgi:hypothetical protein